jgi:hypothetical protein
MRYEYIKMYENILLFGSSVMSLQIEVQCQARQDTCLQFPYTNSQMFYCAIKTIIVLPHIHEFPV